MFAETGDAFIALTRALQAGAPEPAVDAFRALLRVSPPDSRFATWLQHARLQDARLQDAWAHDNGAGRHDPVAAALVEAGRDDVALRLLLARAASRAGYSDCALKLVREARHRAPNREEPLFRLCAMLLTLGDPEAQQLLAEALAHVPGSSPGWGEIGDALLGLGKKDAALICYARTASQDPALAIRRGLLARDLGQLDEARSAFAQAVALAPASARALFLYGTCAQDARDFEAAARAYRATLDRDPCLAEAAVNLGTVLQETRDLDGAKAAYARAIAIRADTFGRIAQALATSPKGELWLDLGRLRRSLGG